MHLPVKKKDRQRYCISRETMEGMRITGISITGHLTIVTTNT